MVRSARMLQNRLFLHSTVSSDIIYSQMIRFIGRGRGRYQSSNAILVPSISDILMRKRHDKTTLSTKRSIAHLPLFGWKVLAATGAVAAAKKVAIVGIVNKYGVKETFVLLRTAISKVKNVGLMDESQEATVNKGLKNVERTIKGLQENEAAQKIYEYLEALEKNNPTVATSVTKVFIENFKSFKVFRTIMNPKHSISPLEEEKKRITKSFDISEQEFESQEEYEALLREMQIKFPQLKNYHVVLVRKEEGETN